MKERKYNLTIFFLIVIFIAVMVTGTIMDKRKYRNKEENKSTQIINETKKSLNSENIKLNKDMSLYEKIKNKKYISMLSIGDDIANSMPIKDEDKWYNNIKTYLEDTYKLKVDTKVIWKEKSKINEALDNYKKEEAKKYDLIFITLGEYNIGYETTEKLAEKYEELIREVLKNNPKSDLYLIVESSIRLDKNYPDTVIKIANHYNLNIVDMRSVFKNSNEAYNALTTDGILPNKKGYDLYKEEIIRLLENNIKNQKQINHEEKQSLYIKS